MSKTKVTVELDSAVYEALFMFATAELEAEILAHIEALYRKKVPKNVRDYIEFSTPNDKPKLKKKPEIREETEGSVSV